MKLIFFTLKLMRMISSRQDFDVGFKKTVRIEDFRILRFFKKNLLNLSKKLLSKEKTYDHHDFTYKIQKKSPTNDNVHFRNDVVFEVTTFTEKKLSCRKHLAHQPRIIFTAIGFCVPMLGCTNFVNSSFHGTNFANWAHRIRFQLYLFFILTELFQRSKSNLQACLYILLFNLHLRW